MALRLIAASKTDVGKQREQNEDAAYVQLVEDERQSTGLFIVADGMGGYHAGEIASKIAVETIRDALQPLLGSSTTRPTVRLNRRGRRNNARARREAAVTQPLPETAEHAENGASAERAPAATKAEPSERAAAATQQLTESMALEHFGKTLEQAVQASSAAVVSYGMEHEEAQGLGSTVTVALVIEGQAFIANVGDSRTYLLRNGTLTRITEDHSLVERLVQARQIDRDDVYDHPSRNLIYRSLGAGKSEVDVDIFYEQLQPGDALLLGSDGLWEMVRDPQLENILNEVQDPHEACDLLVERANENGGEDNITVVLVRCLPG